MISMTRVLFRRRLLIALATLSLTAGVVAPAAVMAAPPSWHMTVISLPSAVSPGNAAGYQVTITNDGPSTISQLYLTTSTANNPPTAFVQGTGCDPVGQELFCSLGALKKGKSATVIVAYDTPTSGTNFSITFEGNTSGATDSDGGTSHGDTVTGTGTTSLDGDTQDFYGAFELLKASVGNNQTLNATNPQTTLVNLPAGSIAVTVEDGAGVSGNCPASASFAADCFGGPSEIHVNQGAIYPGGFSVYIKWDSTLDPPNANSIDIWHEFDTPKQPGNIIGEDITNSCTFQGQSTTPKTIPCVQRMNNLPGGDRQVTVWLTENGKTFGH
jgi:Domain of unknown function DUF11